MTKERSYENLVHFQADTYEQPEFAEWHKIVCGIMDDVRKTKFNEHNLLFWQSKPKNKALDVNHFRGRFSVGSIYINGNVTLAYLSIAFGYKNKMDIHCLDNSPHESLLRSLLNNDLDRIDSMSDTQCKTPSEYVQYCLDKLNERNELLIKILSSKK